MTACKQLPANYLERIVENLAAEEERMQVLYPRFSRDAIKKWLYLESHGYTITHPGEFGFIFSSDYGNSYHMDADGVVQKLKE